MAIETKVELLQNFTIESDLNGNLKPEAKLTINKITPAWAPNDRTKHQKGAQELARLYSSGKRAQEIVCTFTGLALMATDFILIIKHINLEKLALVLSSALCGILTVDFGSGFVHWAADTWGSVDLPIIGRNFLRPFREHHLDPTSITRHDFIETNGDNFLMSLPILLYLSYTLLTKCDVYIQAQLGWITYLYLCAIFAAMTNQIHKWSHTFWGLPKWVILLQSYHLILPRKHHRVHHVAPHASHYCITTGWLNEPLDKIGFWPTLERTIEYLTGCKPRDDDMKWAKRQS